MTKILIYIITLYQKKISPHKGFSCAHKGLHGDDSCSEYTKKQLLEKGVINSIKPIKKRFQECHDAAVTIHQRPPISQRGDCDFGLSGCDLGSCDLGGKGSLPLDCLSGGCDIFSSNKKNRQRDLWILFIITAITLIGLYLVFK